MAQLQNFSATIGFAERYVNRLVKFTILSDCWDALQLDARARVICARLVRRFRNCLDLKQR